MHVYCSVQRWIIIFVSSVLFLLVVLAWYSLSFLTMLSFITCSVCVCGCVAIHRERRGEGGGEKGGGRKCEGQPARVYSAYSALLSIQFFLVFCFPLLYVCKTVSFFV